MSETFENVTIFDEIELSKEQLGFFYSGSIYIHNNCKMLRFIVLEVRCTFCPASEFLVSTFSFEEKSPTITVTFSSVRQQNVSVVDTFYRTTKILGRRAETHLK